jgi:hypothetical protein
MTEQDFDYVQYAKTLYMLPRELLKLYTQMEELVKDFPDYKNVTLTRMLLAAPDCYFQVYRIPKNLATPPVENLATPPVGNLSGGVTVYQTRPADNVEEILDKISQALTKTSNHEPEGSEKLKACMQVAEEQMGRSSYWQLKHYLVDHVVKWMFENYEIGRRLPKVNQDD